MTIFSYGISKLFLVQCIISVYVSSNALMKSCPFSGPHIKTELFAVEGLGRL